MHTASTERAGRGALPQPTLSSQQAAKHLQLSVSTVKRMCDQGLLDSVRTSGRHRRITLASVNAQKRSLRIAESPRHIEIAPEETRLLLLNDPRRLQNDLSDYWESGVPIAAILDRVLAPAMQLVGQMWANEQMDISEEHLCSTHLHETIGVLRSRIRERVSTNADSPIAIGAMSAYDTHSNAASMAQLVFEEHGWKSSNLGAMVPVESLLKAANQWRPRVVWLSYSYVPNRERAIAENDQLVSRLHDQIVIVGGSGIDDSLRSRLRCDFLCASAKELSDAIRSITESPMSVRRSPSTP